MTDGLTDLIPETKPGVYRSSQVNTIDDMKGKYRSPKKALFMSLVLPGLGQAYIGGMLNYIRSGAYLLLEGGLIWGWREFVFVKHDKQVVKYQAYADDHWKHSKYEQGMNAAVGAFNNDYESLKEIMGARESFCEATFASGSNQLETCIEFQDKKSPTEPYDKLPHYIDAQYDSAGLGSEIGRYRRNEYQDLHDFYELIGKHQEFVEGWDDASNVTYDTTGIAGSSDNRLAYRKMRAKATEYSRMQAWFLGGMVMNHLVSALDAAITARFHNKRLYQTDLSWYDRVRLNSYMAFRGGEPVSGFMAYLPF